MKAKLREIFASNVKKALAEAGVSQRKLADSMGTTHQTVQRWVQGQAWPKPEDIDRIADILGIEASFLLGKDSRESNVMDWLRHKLKEDEYITQLKEKFGEERFKKLLHLTPDWIDIQVEAYEETLESQNQTKKA